jgi:anhydro-N-acetylmuramic acid kinase
VDNSKSVPLSATIVGLMSGTSVDGVDVALCRFEEDLTNPGEIELEVLGYSEQSFPPEIRAQVFEAFQEKSGPAQICELNFGLGEVFAGAALQGLAEAGLDPAQVDLISSHGQTLYHQVAAGHRLSTLQMAEPAVIAARTGVTVAFDFRTADVALGGQGAPLAPYFDVLFFSHPTRNRALQNIGGIGNITFLPAGGTKAPLALDTGPGNALMDAAARIFSGGRLQFDRDGEMAGRGSIHPDWLAELMAHPYIQAGLPKSTGREVFGDAFARQLVDRAAQRGLSPEDTLATLTAFTARSIAASIKRFSPVAKLDELIVSGGGAHNRVLLDMLAEWLPGVAVLHHDQFGVPASAKEAVCFALLGYELLRNRPANLPGSTGAARASLLGKLAPGLNFAPLLQKFGPVMLPFSPDPGPSASSKENTSWQTMPRLKLRPTSPG